MTFPDYSRKRSCCCSGQPQGAWPSHYLTTLLASRLTPSCMLLNVHQHMSQQQRHAPYTCTGSISSPQTHPQQIQHLLHQATPACTTGKKAAAKDLSCRPCNNQTPSDHALAKVYACTAYQKSYQKQPGLLGLFIHQTFISNARTIRS